MTQEKYSDYFMKSLANLGYKTCFYLGGGNSMHLLESASRYFECIPVVHEVTAAIAAEYYNTENRADDRAFALVTAGPGMTNLITGIAGAWLDSRELLVIGGQAKSTNLAKGKVRQIGHQEVDGQAIAKPITKISLTIEEPISADLIEEYVSQSWTGRKGPVFLEVCLDVSARSVDIANLGEVRQKKQKTSEKSPISLPEELSNKIKNSRRPLILLGGGVSLEDAQNFLEKVGKWKLPVACTWTGADRANFDYPYFAGRPNTYGMRWANVFQQQSDLLIAVGTSLGFQQTGFNTAAFLPVGEIVHVDIDPNELEKENPKKRFPLELDSGIFLNLLIKELEDLKPNWTDWSDFLNEVRSELPTLEESQKVAPPKISPHEVIDFISSISGSSDSVVAASSGGTFTSTLQNFKTRGDQRLIGNKGLASMGYGLAGAIGLAVARPNGRTILFEGDGGFAQNMQDLGTVTSQNLNLKIFITSNDGYASIRTSQRNYFNGHYLGCDTATGLFLPDWVLVGEAYKIKTVQVNSMNLRSDLVQNEFNAVGPTIFVIDADSEQMYLPKIFSKVDSTGKMDSTALHDMYPALPLNKKPLFRFLPETFLPEFA